MLRSFDYLVIDTNLTHTPLWTFQEIDELCDEWVPESLIPEGFAKEEVIYEPPVLER